MLKNTLVKKLLMKPRERARIVNAPPGYLETLAPLPEGMELSEKFGGPVDFLQLFVKDSKELSRLGPKAIQSVKHDGMLWICYPKRSARMETDLTRDTLWKLMHEHGLLGVSLVSIDAVWSAMRFRPAEAVGR